MRMTKYPLFAGKEVGGLLEAIRWIQVERLGIVIVDPMKPDVGLID